MHFLRSVLGMRNKTLIFNLFGFYKEEVIECIDVIITHVERKITMTAMYTQSQQQASLASSNNNNNNNEDPVRYFLCLRNNIIILYMQLNIFTGRRK